MWDSPRRPSQRRSSWTASLGSLSRRSSFVSSATELTLDRYFGKIQDKDDDYYMQFNIVICGLDSVDARRWMSATLVNLVDPENPESLKPMIDGGTEGALRCCRGRG